jgi:hypothetical protein
MATAGCALLSITRWPANDCHLKLPLTILAIRTKLEPTSRQQASGVCVHGGRGHRVLRADETISETLTLRSCAQMTGLGREPTVRF